MPSSVCLKTVTMYLHIMNKQILKKKKQTYGYVWGYGLGNGSSTFTLFRVSCCLDIAIIILAGLWASGYFPFYLLSLWEQWNCRCILTMPIFCMGSKDLNSSPHTACQVLYPWGSSHSFLWWCNCLLILLRYVDSLPEPVQCSLTREENDFQFYKTYKLISDRWSIN